jgi:CheY-like chemotaxis protein
MPARDRAHILVASINVGTSTEEIRAVGLVLVGADSALSTGGQMEGKRILVVEDEEPIVEFLRFFLEDLDQSVLVARNGQEGLDQARTCQPDLILLDLSLPIVDGRELARQLKADPTTRSIPVVAVTGTVNSSGEPECDTDLEGYLAKPFEVDALEDTLRAIFAR